MVNIRGATLWRLRVMQPVDIRFGTDLRKRSTRQWLMRTLETANPRLAIVEYPCAPWSILQANSEDELAERQERDRPFLRLIEDIFNSQTRRHGHAL